MKKIKPYLALHLILLIYSLSGICSKAASSKQFLSFEFVLFYGLTLFIMAAYALLWQQVLKSIPLNIAYANKAITLIWGMAWGSIVFKEQITISNIIGAVIVLIGVLLMVTGGEKKNE
ncbi:MAG: transporter [Ruminococcaceae bacterium]|nr:transporter [Oscillospiraceae bacterium]